MTCEGTELQFYTDGSCMHSNIPGASYAAFAIACDFATSDAERLQALRHREVHQNVNTIKAIYVSRLPGEQNIHRAEIHALVTLCMMCDNLYAHVDSTAALTLAQEVLQLPTEDEVRMLTEPDLGLMLWRATRTGSYRFSKVAAHKETDLQVDWMTQYHRWGNKVANDAAISACKHLFPTVIAQAEQVAHETKEIRGLFQDYCHYVLALMRARAILDTADAVQPQHTVERLPTYIQCQQYQVAMVWGPEMPTHDLTSQFALGSTWASLFAEWQMELKWPDSEAGSYLQTAGITWLELSLSLCWFAKMWLPQRREDQRGTMRLVAFDSYEHMLTCDIQFAELADMTSILFKQFGNLHNGKFLPDMQRGLMKSLYIQGADIWSSGLSRRPNFPYQTELAEILYHHFCQHRSTSMTAIPALPFQVDQQRVAKSRSQMAKSWHEAGRRAAAATRRIRQAHDPTQRLLSFG